MKTCARTLIATALTLGAAVFAWPVQAFVCEIVPYQDNVPLDRVPKAASEYARQRIAEMQSIFLGRLVSGEYAPLRDGGGMLISTWKVSQWFKGRGGSHANVVEYSSCGENCRIEDITPSIEATQITYVVFVEPFKPRRPFAGEMRRYIDGETRPCKSIYLRQMSNEPLPDRTDPNFGDVIFRNKLRAWLRMHQARKPQMQP